MSDQDLAGLRVLVPRPNPGAEETAKSLRRLGAVPVVFPVLEIVDPDSFSELDQCLADICSVDLLIFVSIHAVNGFASRATYFETKIPEKIRIAAVGPATAKACRDYGFSVSIVPQNRFDSEGLIQALSRESVSGKKVIICRGEQGRDAIRQALIEWDANVQYITTYRTTLTSKDIRPLLSEWDEHGMDCVLVTSISVLNALIECLGKANFYLLHEIDLMVVSERIAKHCLELGIRRVSVCDGADECDLIMGFVKIFGKQN